MQHVLPCEAVVGLNIGQGISQDLSLNQARKGQ